MVIFQKAIDRSTLREGFQIPVEYHSLLSTMPGGFPNQGETRDIMTVIDGQSFPAQLKNQTFDRKKYADHSDVVQIRYGVNSPLATYLRSVFHATWEYVESIKNHPENRGRKMDINVPEDCQEYLVLSTTNLEMIILAECITLGQKELVQDEIHQMDELDFESFTPIVDDTAMIKEMTRVQRIRYLDRSIGDLLKKLYDYRCQMTGEKIGDGYGALVVEAHHIIPFTKSLNNNSSNIIILSPTYHRIVHSANPVWDSKQLAFKYQNGLMERVKVNRHLVECS